MSSGAKTGGDHYGVLGVPRDADTDTIKKAYRKLVREYHPDVAGDDPKAAQRFREVQEAYEVLKDPAMRRRYDRRFEPRRPRSGPDGFRMPGGFTFRTAGQSSSTRMGRDRFRSGSNKMGLDDLFSDFGFGDTPQETARARTTSSSSKSTRSAEFDRSGEAGRRASRSRWTSGQQGAVPGSDLRMGVDVPASTAEKGGSVEMRYARLQASEGGSELHRIQEIYFLRVPPGTSTGDALHCHRWGNAGTDGSCGDLICDVRVVADERAAPAGGAPRARVEPGRRARGGHDHQMLAISLTEAVLGGRVELSLGSSVVMVTIPPLSSGGRRLRLKGKGTGGKDLFLELRVVMPAELDAESRELMAQFALLNPYNPRES